MLGFILTTFLVGLTQGTLHHLVVGTVNGGSLYSLELDDAARTVTLLKNNSAAGASPSLALYQNKLYLYGIQASDATLSKYSVEQDYSINLQGTLELPEACGTRNFKSAKISPGPLNPYNIFGSASTGNCSTVFTTTRSGDYTFQSKDIVGDIRSLAWSSSGRHLYALDFKTNHILNYNIPDDPKLDDLVDIALLTNVTNPRQIVTHPVGHRIYVVTQDSNELLDIPVLQSDLMGTNVTAFRFNVLPSSLANSDYTTQSVAVSASNTTLWTLSRSYGMSVISAFSLDKTTGAVVKPIVRASWRDYSASLDSFIAPAPVGGDLIAITNSPQGVTAFIELQGTGLKSYPRLDLGQDLGEGLWLN
ncbi:hypothetical protein EJ04DRAFT_117474 [Polyplosphaeria fusca]|uniref:Uncharacterized protein n=1 Tax=Polyplosphaeria fusca TaxID=682080 RepID=A0A9P4V5F2_9PLEO|nr:hypothetical protein EJ04DRAFT_117474 [Polyplosphaeria fusca]